jgi:hypothetical protein
MKRPKAPKFKLVEKNALTVALPGNSRRKLRRMGS